jgi:hypothetical protein
MAVLESSHNGPQRAANACGDEAALECNTVETATARLIAALDGLEAVVEHRHAQERGQQMLAEQVQLLGVDRARLAADLDEKTAHARRLEATNREIARRLDLAMETIRSVLDAQGTLKANAAIPETVGRR